MKPTAYHDLNSPLTLNQGIGTMGYPMAINLRKKLPKSSRLIISELNREAVRRFVEETKDVGEVIAAQAPRESNNQAKIPSNDGILTIQRVEKNPIFSFHLINPTTQRWRKCNKVTHTFRLNAAGQTASPYSPRSFA